MRLCGLFLVALLAVAALGGPARPELIPLNVVTGKTQFLLYLDPSTDKEAVHWCTEQVRTGAWRQGVASRQKTFLRLTPKKRSRPALKKRSAPMKAGPGSVVLLGDELLILLQLDPVVSGDPRARTVGVSSVEAIDALPAGKTTPLLNISFLQM